MERAATNVVVIAAPDDVPPGLGRVQEQATVVVGGTTAELAEAIGDAEVLLVWDFRTDVLRELWPRARQVRWIHAASAGLDVVLFPEVVGSDVVVTNSRGVFNAGIAEFVLGVLLAFAKDLRATFDLQRRRIWRHRETQLLSGRSVLVVGAGSIGRDIARLLRCLGMRVSGLARSERRDDPDFGRVAPTAELDDLLPDADVVVIAAPLTRETRGMFGPREFARMKPEALLVNVGRGAIVDEDALVEALEEKRVAAAAMDVFAEEPLPADHPFWGMDNVIVSAHMAGDVVGWREALVELFAENLHRWERGEELRNVVDKERAHALLVEPGTGAPS